MSAETSFVETDPNLGARIVEDAKEFVLYSWSVQDKIDPIAVAGAALSGALVSAHLAMVPSPTWRASWWWVPLSLLVLAFGATLGKALEHVLAVVPIIAAAATGSVVSRW